MKRHECPEDPAAFFAQLFAVLTYRPDVPDGYVECRVCGGIYPAPSREVGRLPDAGEGQA